MNEHARIVLTEDLPEHRLQAGDVGTIIHVYTGAQAFEVEFVALTGKTIAVVSIPSDRARPVREDELTHARPIPATG